MKADTKRGKKVVGVLLTAGMAGRIGKFIYARKVDPDGPYFTIVVSRRTQMDSRQRFRSRIIT